MNITNAKCLVAYFSHSGNTRVIAHEIQAHVGGDIFEIVPVDPYPRDYDAVVAKARKELDVDSRPTLKTNVENMGLYNVVFVGYPNWWGTVPGRLQRFWRHAIFPEKPLYRFARTREEVWGEVLPISKNFARSQLSWTVLPSGAAM